MPSKSMSDASVPNAGRIYDYLLGGHHNFEVDRLAAEWHGIELTMTEKDLKSFDPGGSGYGIYLIK